MPQAGDPAPTVSSAAPETEEVELLPRELTSEERTMVGHTMALYRESNDGRTPHGLTKRLAMQYRVTSRTVRNIRSRYDQGVALNDMRVMRSKPRPGRSIVGGPDLLESLEAYAQDVHFDFTWEEAAQYIGGISSSTLRRRAVSAGWRSVYGRIVPLLSDSHKAARLAWAREHRRQSWDAWVDVDEKWFYTIVRRRKKVPAGQAAPMHKTQSKRFIGKTMFLAAVARPRPELNFDGCVGIWRFCETTTAKRSSKNRPKGAAVIENVEVTASKFREMIELRLVPAIRRKMPWASSVTVQFDGPKTHTGGGNTARFDEVAKSGNTRIDFIVQPAQSPDTNTLDLGIFNHLQTHVDKEKRFASAWDVDVLSDVVKKKFFSIPEHVLEGVFAAKSNVLGEILKCDGDNTYTVPHSQK